MKLRPARTMDVFPLVEILVERHKDTIYAGHVGIDEVIARKTIAYTVQRHGGQNEGAGFVMVAVDADDVPQAFMMGSLVRVYLVGDMLEAVDNFLIGRAGVSPIILDRLLDTYVQWAIDNPKVYEVQGSYTDIIEGSDRFDAVFRRKGFKRCGAIFRRLPHAEARETAA